MPWETQEAGPHHVPHKRSNIFTVSSLKFYAHTGNPPRVWWDLALWPLSAYVSFWNRFSCGNCRKAPGGMCGYKHLNSIPPHSVPLFSLWGMSSVATGRDEWALQNPLNTLTLQGREKKHTRIRTKLIWGAFKDGLPLMTSQKQEISLHVLKQQGPLQRRCLEVPI